MRFRYAATLFFLLCLCGYGSHGQTSDLSSSAPLATGATAGSTGPRRLLVNGRPYVHPTQHDLLRNYVSDTYGLPGLARTLVRATYAEARGKPSGWGQDPAGYGQRFGSSAAVTAINGTVRYGFENLFHEDLRYLPCHGCRWPRKLENAFLAEITARHEDDGHRVFSLTPTIADMSGPIIAHTLWYPGASAGPEEGAVTARTVFATRIGAHLFQEFVWERRHHHERGAKATAKP